MLPPAVAQKGHARTMQNRAMNTPDLGEGDKNCAVSIAGHSQSSLNILEHAARVGDRGSVVQRGHANATTPLENAPIKNRQKARTERARY